MKRNVTAVVLLGMLQIGAAEAGAAAIDNGPEAQELIRKSAAVIDRFRADKKFSWLHEHFKLAQGVMIFPRVVRAGFFWGGSGGQGVLVVRCGQGDGWSQPVFYSVGSISYGLQIGGQEAEVVMLVMSRKAINSLMASSLKFGGDVAVAAGPHGAGAKRELTADFISFARTKGLYAGLNFEGSIVRVRDDLNRSFYGREVRPIQIIEERLASNPASERLLQAVREAAR